MTALPGEWPRANTPQAAAILLDRCRERPGANENAPRTIAIGHPYSRTGEKWPRAKHDVPRKYSLAAAAVPGREREKWPRGSAEYSVSSGLSWPPSPAAYLGRKVGGWPKHRSGQQHSRCAWSVGVVMPVWWRHSVSCLLGCLSGELPGWSSEQAACLPTYLRYLGKCLHCYFGALPGQHSHCRRRHHPYHCCKC